MNKKAFFNPVSNAKTIAFLFFLLALAGVSNILFKNITVMDLLTTTLYLVVGIGLRKTKKWGVYALGTLLLLEFPGLYYAFKFPEFQSDYLLSSIISILIVGVPFVWFYKNIKKFK